MPAPQLCLALALLAAHPQDGPDADLRLATVEGAVRLDLFLNLVYVDELVDLPRADPARLDPRDEAALRARLFELLAERVTVQADGRRLAPVERGFDFLPAEEPAAALFPVFGARAAAKVRLALEWPVAGEPAELAFTWDAFVPDLARDGAPPVELALLLELGADERVLPLTADSPRVEWSASEAAPRPLPAPPPPPALEARTLPGLSLALACGLALALGLAFARPGGRRARRPLLLVAPFALAAAVSARDLCPIRIPGGPAPVDAAQARAVLAPLLESVHAAFDLRGEEPVYDALARSVSGELLERLYLDLRRSLVLEQAGGALARVESLELVELELERAAPDAFRATARWRADAVVHHWGHSHRRTNEPLARLEVRADAQGWRLVACELLELRRTERR